MIYGINFADDNYKSAQKFNSKMAKKYGVDKVIEYGPEDIDEQFKRKNESIWNNSKGCGYWVWKPYIVKKTLDCVDYGDYVIYMDSGCCLMADIHIFINIMLRDKIDIMLFDVGVIEKFYSKRDAFILLDCDKPEFTETSQRLGGYFILRKCDSSITFVEEWLYFAQDRRIITDEDNVMGMLNYDGFVENRHDQTIFSLLSKKWNIQPYRDPSQYGNLVKCDQDILERSSYLQMIDLHRQGCMPKSYFVYKYMPKNVYGGG